MCVYSLIVRLSSLFYELFCEYYQHVVKGFQKQTSKVKVLVMFNEQNVSRTSSSREDIQTLHLRKSRGSNF